MIHAWHLVGWGNMKEEGEWAHVGVGGCKTSRGQREEEPTKEAHSATAPCLFAECLQIDPATLPSGTVYFSRL